MLITKFPQKNTALSRKDNAVEEQKNKYKRKAFNLEGKTPSILFGNKPKQANKGNYSLYIRLKPPFRLARPSIAGGFPSNPLKSRFSRKLAGCFPLNIPDILIKDASREQLLTLLPKVLGGQAQPGSLTRATRESLPSRVSKSCGWLPAVPGQRASADRRPPGLRSRNAPCGQPSG